jgi:hypothetical protein
MIRKRKASSGNLTNCPDLIFWGHRGGRDAAQTLVRRRYGETAKYGRKVSSEAYRRRTRARPPRNNGEGSPVTNFAEEEAASRGRDCQSGPGCRGFRSTNTLSGQRAEPGLKIACSCGGRRSQAKKLQHAFQNVHFWTDALTCMSFSACVSASVFQRQNIIRNAAKVTGPVVPGLFAERKAERCVPWTASFSPSLSRDCCC